MGLFYVRSFNQSNIVIIFKSGIKCHIPDFGVIYPEQSYYGAELLFLKIKTFLCCVLHYGISISLSDVFFCIAKYVENVNIRQAIAMLVHRSKLFMKDHVYSTGLYKEMQASDIFNHSVVKLLWFLDEPNLKTCIFS